MIYNYRIRTKVLPEIKIYEREMSFLYRLHIILDRIPIAQCKNVLDIGIGHAYLLSYIKEVNPECNVTGVDIDYLWETKINKERVEKYGIRKVVCDISQEKIPLNEKFDVIIFSEVLEHLNFNKKSKEELIDEIYNLLEPNGLLIVATPNVASLAHIIALWLNRNFQDEFNDTHIKGRLKYGRSPHIREYTIPELEKLFSKFKIEKIETFYRPGTSWFFKIPIKRFRDNVLLILRKQ